MRWTVLILAVGICVLGQAGCEDDSGKLGSCYYTCMPGYPCAEEVTRKQCCVGELPDCVIPTDCDLGYMHTWTSECTDCTCPPN